MQERVGKPNKILVASTGMDGHLNPMMPLIQTLHEKGHQVVVATQDSYSKENLKNLGVEYFDAGNCEDTDEMREFHKKRMTLHGRELASHMQGAFTGIRARQMTPLLREAIKDFKPQVLIGEDFCFAAPMAAELENIPYACYQVTAPRPDIMALSGSYLNQARREFGLEEVRDLGYLSRFLHLSNRPSGLVMPSLRERLTYQAFRNSSVQSNKDYLPDNMKKYPNNPNIHVTLGTVPIFNSNIDIFQAAIDGLEGEDYNLFITTGKNQDPTKLRHQTDRVVAERYRSLGEFLPKTDTMIFHGGSGSLTAAVEYSIPMIVIPLGADQFINAKYIQEVGAGVVLPREEVTPERIRQSVDEALENPKYSEAMEQLHEEWLSLPDINYAVYLIEKLAKFKQPIIPVGHRSRLLKAS